MPWQADTGTGWLAAVSSPMAGPVPDNLLVDARRRVALRAPSEVQGEPIPAALDALDLLAAAHPWSPEEATEWWRNQAPPRTAAPRDPGPAMQLPAIP